MINSQILSETGILEGLAARRFAALWYTNPARTWSCWQRVLWWLVLHCWTVKVIFDRKGSHPYLLRATLIPRTALTWPVYLHYGFKKDDEWEQHNHPWDAWSLILSEGYLEERGNRSVTLRKPGTLVRLKRDTFHRILSGGWFSLFIPQGRIDLPREVAWGFRDPATGEYWHHERYIELKRGIVPRSSKAPKA